MLQLNLYHKLEAKKALMGITHVAYLPVPNKEKQKHIQEGLKHKKEQRSRRQNMKLGFLHLKCHLNRRYNLQIQKK